MSVSDGSAIAHDIHHAVKINLGNTWVALSTLQKAIRSNHVELALSATSFLSRHDPQRFWKRLPVIAMEDVGHGDLGIVARVCWISGKRVWRAENGGDIQLSHDLVSALCAAPKNRDACDLAVVADTEPRLQSTRDAMSVLPDDTLWDTFLDRSQDVAVRMLAAWYLAGTNRYPGAALHSRKGTPQTLVQLMCEAGVSGSVLDQVGLTLGRTREPMPVGLTTIAVVNRTGSSKCVENAVPRPIQIEGWPAYAFDYHTRPGRRAIRAFGRRFGFAEFVGKIGSDDARLKALAMAVFRVEGARVDRRCVLDGVPDLVARADIAQVAGHGVPVDRAREFLDCVRERLPALDEARVDALREGW